MPTFTLAKVVSGGQTGVDRAALDAALEAGLPVGGWCPRGHRAEDGPLDPRYPLTETPSPEYDQRTAWNVRDSDGTLILHANAPSKGTNLTEEVARRSRKPLLRVDLDNPPPIDQVAGWLREHHVEVLNVAGPRESEQPGIYHAARDFLTRVLHHVRCA